MSSRIPALNEKAMMGGSTSLSSLSFDIIYEPDDKAPILEQIWVNAANWTYTNRQGMTFGILLSALLMTLLAQINTNAVRNRFANSAMGTFVGSGLGVCVNCAAPIAQGLYKGGMRKETAIATMISSPTMNFIVLTMVFSLFPFYLALIKVGLTLTFTLLVLPLLIKWIPDRRPIDAVDDHSAMDAQVCTIADSPMSGWLPQSSDTNWFSAFQWFLVTYARNFWYIVKLAVPLMLLAGLLGAVAITLLPLDRLIEILPTSNVIVVLLSFLCLALMCLFLPVPMAFDVIVCAVLLAAGMPVMYVGVILFTLGVFSVYGLFIAAHILSKRVAVAVFFVLLLFGVSSGVLSKIAGDWNTERENQLLAGTLAELSTDYEPASILVASGIDADPLPFVAESENIKWAPLSAPITGEQASIAASDFVSPAASSINEHFSPIPLETIGLDAPYSFRIDQALIMQFRSIASEDINADGWPDIVIGSSPGLHVYFNNGGIGFYSSDSASRSSELEFFKDKYVTNAALVNLRGDALPDLFVATYDHGNYLLINREGSFDSANRIALPNQSKALRTVSSAFGDIDSDGNLDVVVGNWSHGVISHSLSLSSSSNVWLENTGSEFVVKELSGQPGETLSSLLSDINLDGNLDLFIGNDFDVSDAFYTGAGTGEFTPMHPGNAARLRSTVTTMSIASADINNDLVPELFMSQISELPKASPELKRIGPALCEEVSNSSQKDACIEIQSILKPVVGAINRSSLAECFERVPERFQQDCAALLTLYTGTFTGNDPQRCDSLPNNWSHLKAACNAFHTMQSSAVYSPSTQSIPNSDRFNVLLQQNASGELEDVAADLGLQLTGWAWNSKFADINNDGWQDLFVTNGQMGLASAYPNLLFLNDRTGSFKVAEKAGLESWFDTGAYTYTDFDNDGDLDIFALPQAGSVLAYRNNSVGNSVRISLQDTVSNSRAVGAKIFVYYGTDNALHQFRELQLGGGFNSFDVPEANFGLGEQDNIARVRVVWPDGTETTVNGPLAANKHYRIQR